MSLNVAVMKNPHYKMKNAKDFERYFFELYKLIEMKNDVEAQF